MTSCSKRVAGIGATSNTLNASFVSCLAGLLRFCRISWRLDAARQVAGVNLYEICGPCGQVACQGLQIQFLQSYRGVSAKFRSHFNFLAEISMQLR